MTTQKLPPEIEKLRDEKSEQVGIPHFAKSLSERAGHIATFKDGFEAGALAVLEQADKLAEALDVVVTRHEQVGGDARKQGIPLGIYTVCKKYITEWRKFRGME